MKSTITIALSAIVSTLLLLSFTFLSSQQNAISPTDQEVLTILLKVLPSKEDTTYTFTIEKTIVGKGFLKKGVTSTSRTANQEDFIFSFLTATRQVAYKTSISNPFKTPYEYADESGALHTVLVPQKEQIIPLRVNYDSSLELLRIEQKTNNQLRVLNDFVLEVE